MNKNILIIFYFIALAATTVNAYEYVGCFEDAADRDMGNYLGVKFTIE
jgi:hypothetical protein